MNKIIAIAWKDTIIRFSSRSEILFFIILPLLFTFLLTGGAARLGEDTESGESIGLTIVDRDNSPQSAALLSALESSAVLHIQDIERNASDRMAVPEEGAVLLIPAGFGPALTKGTPSEVVVKVGARANGDLIGQVANSAVSAVTRPYEAPHAAAQIAQDEHAFSSPGERDQFFAAALEEAQQSVSSTQEWLLETQPGSVPGGSEYDAAAYQSVGQMVTWVFIPLLGLSALMAYERTEGTLRRLFTTPTERHTYLLGTLSGQVTLALVQMGLIIGFAVLILKIDWGRSPSGLALILVTFALAAAALGTAMGAFVRTSSQAANLSIMIGMLFALLGGAWVPQEIFPAGLQAAVKILPTTWAMQGLMDIVIRRQGIVDVLPETAVLLGFFVLFLSVGVYRFRIQE